MSDKSQELLLGDTVMPPERLDEDETNQQEFIDNRAIYDSGVADIMDHVGHPDFKFIYFQTLPDIREQFFKWRHRFVEKMLDKISEVYDFEFFEKTETDTDYELEQMHLFIQFLEFDNFRFLAYVWRFLKQDLQKIDIEQYCKSNAMKIIKETEEQLETHPQTELITKFLRTYYKEKYIEWFLENTEKSKIMIILEILESEGKLNG